MIPKIIHYCWFGNGEIPEKNKKCIDSWKRFCPDYEIIEWNESNYDISKNKFMKQAYDEKKWAFVSDVARLDIIYRYGGIYLDTDVELIKNLDELLVNKGYAGFEEDSIIAVGLGFGAEKENSTIKAFLDAYSNISFYNEDGSLNMPTIPKVLTRVLISLGFEMNNTKQTIGDFTVYPNDYFCPLNYETGKLDITDNTFSIHWFNASWLSDNEKNELEIKRKYNRKYGIRLGNVIFKLKKYFGHPKRLYIRLKRGHYNIGDK